MSGDILKKETTEVPIGELHVGSNGSLEGSVHGLKLNGPRPRMQWYYVLPKDVFWYSMLCFLVGSSLFVTAGAMYLWTGETTEFDVAAVTAWLGFFGICLYQTGCWCGIMDAVNLDRKKPGWHPSKFRYFGFDFKSWYWWGWALFFFGTPFFVVPNFMVLPGVMPVDFDYEARWVEWDLVYWMVLTIGGLFFVAGSTCSFIGSQGGKLWNPKIADLTWWATLLYDIGSVGFTLSAVFGFFAYTGEGGFTCCQWYGTSLSYFWGSICFLVATYILMLDTFHKDELEVWRRGNSVV